MKSATILAALLFFLSSFFISCTNIYDGISSSEEILQNGKWSVEYYYDEVDKTAELFSVRLKFNKDNTVSYCENSDTCIGNWQFVKNVRNEMLQLQFDDSHTLVQPLNQHWNLEDLNLQRVELSNGSVHIILRKI
ncbi:MAG: hypothetical protein M3413_09390 [Bacteroidota bacterium]|jgi:hypothetical protein|nr:hypothetical protein [Bacteroidota bacterium]